MRRAIEEKRRTNGLMEKERRKRTKDRVKGRPRKCLQGASQEEVPVAVTTAVPLVAMGTRREKNSLVNKAKPAPVLLAFSGKEA